MNKHKERKIKIFGYYYSEEFFNNKFNHLLTVFVVMFLITPLLENQAFSFSFPFTTFIFTTSILFTLRVVIENKRQFHFISFITILGFVLVLILSYLKFHNNIEIIILTFTILIFTFCLFYSISILLSKLMSEDKVESDTIKGGICLYLLIGLAWSMLYFLVYLYDDKAFSGRMLNNQGIHLFQYYSFTVLTTLGFGDIIPVDMMAVNLTNLEAIAGQMFLGIFIARLIGMHMAHEIKKSNNQETEG